MHSRPEEFDSKDNLPLVQASEAIRCLRRPDELKILRVADQIDESIHRCPDLQQAVVVQLYRFSRLEVWPFIVAVVAPQERAKADSEVLDPVSVLLNVVRDAAVLAAQPLWRTGDARQLQRQVVDLAAGPIELVATDIEEAVVGATALVSQAGGRVRSLRVYDCLKELTAILLELQVQLRVTGIVV